MLPTKFQDKWPLGSKNAKTIFSRWSCGHLDFRSKHFSYFKSTSHSDASHQVFKAGLSIHKKKGKIIFQDGGHGGHLGISIGMIVAMFDLQVTTMFPTKFGVNWPVGVEGVGS